MKLPLRWTLRLWSKPLITSLTSSIRVEKYRFMAKNRNSGIKIKMTMVGAAQHAWMKTVKITFHSFFMSHGFLVKRIKKMLEKIRTLCKNPLILQRIVHECPRCCAIIPSAIIQKSTYKWATRQYEDSNAPPFGNCLHKFGYSKIGFKIGLIKGTWCDS